MLFRRRELSLQKNNFLSSTKVDMEKGIVDEIDERERRNCVYAR